MYVVMPVPVCGLELVTDRLGLIAGKNRIPALNMSLSAHLDVYVLAASGQLF